MGRITQPSPALLILAAFSQFSEALEWTRDKAVGAWGPLAMESDRFAFTETDYYRASMGSRLQKQLFAFAAEFDPARLADIKHVTNAWEAACAAELGETIANVPRALNLDPGYLTGAKLVLASTKNHAHRIYLSDGIYAEITLQYRSGRWQPCPWTYPDYRRVEYLAFFQRCRQYLRRGRRS